MTDKTNDLIIGDLYNNLVILDNGNISIKNYLGKATVKLNNEELNLVLKKISKIVECSK